MSIQDIKTSMLSETEGAVEKAFGQKLESRLKVGFPPNVQMGDFAVECFPLAKQFRQNPAQIAQKVVSEIPDSELIQEVKAVGPYLNFKLSPQVFFGDVCTEIIMRGSSFGDSQIGEDQRVMVEYLSPNTNKPLHLGHLRNGALGMSVANLLEATGHTVVKANLVNDRGVHICKSMLAYQVFGKHNTPDAEHVKPDHFVGRFYVLYETELKKEREIWLQEKGIDWDSLDSQSQQQTEAQFLAESKWNTQVRQLLQEWEAGDKETIELWQKMNSWVYDGFEQTYKDFGLEFDVFYYESNTYKLGKDIIARGLEKKVFYRDQRGAIVFELPEKEMMIDKDGKPKEVTLFGRDKDGNLRKVTVLRADGTSVYMTQDIGTALLKVEEHKLDHSIYVVGREQDHHFKCLFKIMESLGYPWAGGLYHLSYGMVNLPEGKMKSREGKVVDADDIIAEMTKLAAQEIRKRDPKYKISEQEAQKRAAKIGVGAIKFFLLKVGPDHDLLFDPAESISFDGTTGPYCQYAYARCAGILRKAQEAKIELKDINFSVLGNQEELILIQKLLQFPDKVWAAAKAFNPAILASHIYETAQAFNQFYKHSVLSAENEELIKARLALVQATAIVLKKGLSLLGIEALEEM